MARKTFRNDRAGHAGRLAEAAGKANAGCSTMEAAAPMEEPAVEAVPPADEESEVETSVPEAAPPPAVVVEAAVVPTPPAPLPSPAQQPALPLALMGGLGAAAALLILRKLLRKGKRKQLDAYGAFLEYIELEAAQNPAAPAAPLLLSGLRFAWKDM